MLWVTCHPLHPMPKAAKEKLPLKCTPGTTKNSTLTYAGLATLLGMGVGNAKAA